MRHPALAIAEGVCYGALDVALAEPPEQGARALMQRLHRLGAPAPDAMQSSPLTRAAAVTAALAAQWGRDGGGVWHSDERLREMNFGTWEGQRWDAIERAALEAWAADLLGARPHGGESVAQVSARVGQWLAAVSSHDDAVLHAVTHAGVMRVLAAQALALPLEHCLAWPLETGRIVWLRRARAGQSWSLLHWNA